MRFIACASTLPEAERLSGWVEAHCRRRGAPVEAVPLMGVQRLWSVYVSGSARCVLLDLGDEAGFAAARRLRELDRECAIIFVGDTNRFAIRCLRLHVTDYLLRPVSRERLERGVDRVLER